MTERILIIRLGALGDIFLCMKPFQDIRKAYPDAHVTLLTTPPFKKLAESMPYFNAVITDTRPSFLRPDLWWRLGQTLKAGHFTRVFDLQNKPRTHLYYRLFFRKVKWSGTAKGCTDPRPSITQKIHRQQEHIVQLRAAGVPDSGPLDLGWMQGQLDGLGLPSRYAVLVPGCSPHLLHKRWPPDYFAELALRFQRRGLGVVVVGTGADAEPIAAIRRLAPFVVDLTGKTSLHQLASLYRGAEYVVGNDTGPTFLAAMAGAKTLTLMSYHTDPVLSGPIGPHCAYIKRDNLAALTPDDVEGAMPL